MTPTRLKPASCRLSTAWSHVLPTQTPQAVHSMPSLKTATTTFAKTVCVACFACFACHTLSCGCARMCNAPMIFLFLFVSFCAPFHFPLPPLFFFSSSFSSAFNAVVEYELCAGYDTSQLCETQQGCSFIPTRAEPCVYGDFEPPSFIVCEVGISRPTRETTATQAISWATIEAVRCLLPTISNQDSGSTRIHANMRTQTHKHIPLHFAGGQ